MKRTDSKKIKKRKKWPWIIAVIGLIIGCFAFSVFFDLTSTLKGMYKPIDRESSEKREEEVVFRNQDPFSVLILGVDEREGDKGRSDTMIVMAVNPKLKSTKMVSIPRDTYTEIVGHGTTDKLNHAYAFGGIQMSMDSVENLLDIPIDYVMEVNMEGFQSIVDAVGGVSVNNPFEFTQDSIQYAAGNITLTGKEALSYVRMRKDDPSGDFGRQDRQKQVIEGVLREGTSVKSLLKYRSVFNALGDNVTTNMTFDEMVDIQKDYRDAADKVEQLHFEKGEGTRMNDGIWYYIMDDTELLEITSAMKQHLELN
ncbi:LytR family transcriptional regulator [Sporosarcina sp. ANT_H38]|uniref:LCP family glycopolymer transferase n=1 Tax=Sporosarcina sp. ANT_H38 TaxID=2597358 RepID=UPI0011F33837|nr:LCP family protein [Sporosarcina sp. ANT_H38]KAA0965468.1 LytR family transcriptional regulator [Sporosarcina sp. ANT_H38]